MANKARGENTLTINGDERTIVMTLGALAELEGELGVGIQELGTVMQGEGGKQMQTIVAILYWMLKAGGWKDLQRSEMISLSFDLNEFMEKFKVAMEAAGFGGKEGS